jgi:hypothetical protein
VSPCFRHCAEEIDTDLSDFRSRVHRGGGFNLEPIVGVVVENKAIQRNPQIRFDLYGKMVEACKKSLEPLLNALRIEVHGETVTASGYYKIPVRKTGRPCRVTCRKPWIEHHKTRIMDWEEPSDLHVWTCSQTVETDRPTVCGSLGGRRGCGCSLRGHDKSWVKLGPIDASRDEIYDSVITPCSRDVRQDLFIPTNFLKARHAERFKQVANRVAMEVEEVSHSVRLEIYEDARSRCADALRAMGRNR